MKQSFSSFQPQKENMDSAGLLIVFFSIRLWPVLMVTALSRLLPLSFQHNKDNCITQ